MLRFLFYALLFSIMLNCDSFLLSLIAVRVACYTKLKPQAQVPQTSSQYLQEVVVGDVFEAR